MALIEDMLAGKYEVRGRRGAGAHWMQPAHTGGNPCPCLSKHTPQRPPTLRSAGPGAPGQQGTLAQRRQV